MTPQPRIRERWIDIARAIAIVLVVLFHAVIFLDQVGMAGWWPRVNGLLDSFRMPMFFTLAGLLSGSVMRRSGRSLWRDRVAPLLYLYVIWCIIQLVFSAAVGGLSVQTTDERQPPLLAQIGSDLVLPDPNLWFLIALAGYTTYQWALRRVAWQRVLLLSACVSLLLPPLLALAAEEWVKPARYLLFFTLGSALPNVIRRIASSATVARTSVAGVVFIAALLGIRLLDGTLRSGMTDVANVLIPTLTLALGPLAVVTGIGAACLLDRAGGPLARGLGLLGQRTLPVYLLHTLPMTLTVAIVGQQSAAANALLVGNLLVPSLVVVAIGLSLATYAATRRIPGIYALPHVTPRTTEMQR